MTSIITTPTQVPSHIKEFVESLNVPNDRIRQSLYQYPSMIEKLSEDLKTPLPDEVPDDVKICCNDKLQQWFVLQAEFPRYFVKKVPNFVKIPSEEQLYLHSYFDGVLAMFEFNKVPLINRVSPENTAKIQQILKN